jgi:hypothetical protein
MMFGRVGHTTVSFFFFGKAFLLIQQLTREADTALLPIGQMLGQGDLVSKLGLATHVVSVSQQSV